MLQNIRDSKGLGRNILIGLIIVVFAMWGVESIVGSLLNDSTVVVVNGEKISEVAVDNAYQQQYQAMLQTLGPDGDPSDIDEDLLRELSINELIQRTLLNELAEGNNMELSSQTLDRMVLSTEAFQINGVYNDEMATNLLANAGLTPASYRALLAEDEKLNQITMAYAGSGFITRDELQRFAALAEQTRDVRVLRLDYFDQSMDMDITEEEVNQYYELNQDDFIREEMVSVEYVLLSRIDLMDQVEVSEEQILAQYEADREAFEAQTERRASHILFEASPEETEAALAEAEQVRARIIAGESFDDLAAEFSDDTGSAAYGGDVGYTTGDSFVEPFEEALQQLELEELSEPVVSEFGVHLIKLTDIIRGEFASLDDSREQIVRDLQLEGASALYEAKQEQLELLAFETFDLQSPSEELGLPILNTERFRRQGGSGLAANAAFIAAAFDPVVLEDQLNSDLIELDEDTSVVLHIRDHVLPEVRPLEEVRIQIELLLRQEKVRALARNTGESIVSSLEQGNNIDTMLSELGLEWQEYRGLGRDAAGLNPELLQWLFTLEAPEEGQTAVGGTLLSTGVYVVAEVSNVVPGAIESLEEGEVEALEAYVSQQTGFEDRASMMAELQANADIKQ